MITDGELVRRVAAGDSAAYGELARRWYCRILAFCHSRLTGHSLQDAEDLTQDVMLRGYRNLNKLKIPDHFGIWVRGIAKNVCADWWRNKPSESYVNGEFPLQSACAKGDVELNEDRIVILHEVASIPEPLKEVVLLHYYEDLTYEEIAEWLGISRATVNERLAKARSLLRVRLAKLRSDV